MVIIVHFISFKENVTSSNNSGAMEEMEPDRPAQNSSMISAMCRQCGQECINTMLLTCNHACVCLNCGEHLKQEKGACPCCSKPVEDILFPVNFPNN